MAAGHVTVVWLHGGVAGVGYEVPFSEVPGGSLCLVYLVKEPGGRRFLRAVLNTAPLQEVDVDALTPGATVWMSMASFLQGTEIPPTSRWRRTVWQPGTPRELEPVKNIPTIGPATAQGLPAAPRSQPAPAAQAPAEVRGKDIRRGELLLAYVERKSDRHLELVVWRNEPPYERVSLDNIPADTQMWQCAVSFREGAAPPKWAPWRLVHWVPSTRRVYPPHPEPNLWSKAGTALLDLWDHLADAPVSQGSSHSSAATEPARPPDNGFVNAQPAMFPEPSYPSWHEEQITARDIKPGMQLMWQGVWQGVGWISSDGPNVNRTVEMSGTRVSIPMDQRVKVRRWY